jgi:hypothetical protein
MPDFEACFYAFTGPEKSYSYMDAECVIPEEVYISWDASKLEVMDNDSKVVAGPWQWTSVRSYAVTFWRTHRTRPRVGQKRWTCSRCRLTAKGHTSLRLNSAKI